MKKLKTYKVIILLCLILLSLCAVVPFILLVISSLTEEAVLMRNGYSFFPETWSTAAYAYLFEHSSQIFRAYGISIFVTVAGTAAGLLITLLLAYPLADPELPGRKAVNFLIFFTMLFNGGLVPTYIMYTTYFGMKNNILSLIIPNLLVKAFYVILARSYFQNSIPKEIMESARIDGAGEIRIFKDIVFPLSKPIVTTLLLFIGLGYWNDWNNGLVYLTDPKLYSIQNVLNDMIRSIQFLSTNSGVISTTTLPSNGVRMAIAVVCTLPVLIAYPFLQKGFVKGIVMGGVKG